MEVQDIFVRYGQSYRLANGHRMTSQQKKAMKAIEACRTRELGGHIDQCDVCGVMRISYNSCRNRHCPKCQFLRREIWLEKRMDDLLPIQYFHVVFTLPDILNKIALANQREIYSLMFTCASETLRQLSRDEKYCGAHIGFFGVLHTWGQNLQYHPHIHFIVTGGGLSFDHTRWINCRHNYLFPVTVLSHLFKGKFLSHLKSMHSNNTLIFHESKNDFYMLLDSLYKKEWVVYSKRPFKNSKTAFQYLSSYTHRVAISNYRIIKVEHDKVYFSWRDYTDANKKKVMNLDVHEFIRRFLIHILPHKFVKMRHYGFLANRNKKRILDKCFQLLHGSHHTQENIIEKWQQKLLRVSEIDITLCPHCQKGKMIHVEKLVPLQCNSP